MLHDVVNLLSYCICVEQFGVAESCSKYLVMLDHV